jgi:hypothetical protein
MRLENYAEWWAGMEQRLDQYAMQATGGQSSWDVELCKKRLMLLENNENTRKLIKAVHDSIPVYGTPDFEFLELSAHGESTLSWPPFDEAIDALVRHVRARIDHDKP